MTDEELAETCALEILGWECGGAATDWEPLESWDDCMMVVAAMRANRYALEIIGDLVEFVLPHEGEFHPDRSVAFTSLDDMRRAILRAALKAVRSKT